MSGLMGRAVGAGVAIAACMMALPAAAQDGWDVETDAERGIVVASVIYDGGVGIAVQCRDYQLDLVVLGVPVPEVAEITDQGHRVLDTGTSTDALVTSSWKAEAGSPVVTSVYPARFARSLKRAEAYIVGIPSHGDRPARRMAIPLPSDSSGIDQVLTACDRRTEDARDALPMIDPYLVPGWQVEGFDYSGGRFEGTARLEYSCILTAENTVRDCQIDFERPAGGGLGRKLVANQGRARVTHDVDPADLEGRIIYMPQGQIGRTIVVDYEIIM